MDRRSHALHRVFGLAIAALFSEAAALADVVDLKDGSRVEGTLRFCDEESCSIDKRRIERAQIVTITLRTLSPRPALREPGVILTDGTTRSGVFTGLTLGYVEVGGKEIDRETVAVIVVAPPPAQDVLIGPDASQRRGAITLCNAASCTLDGVVVAFQNIRWIGLGANEETPPLAPDADLVFVRDQQTVTARLSALDDHTVRTTHGSFPRNDVTWIRLASPRDDVTTAGGFGAPPDRPNRPTSAPSPVPQAPPPSAAPPSGNARRGGLWTGKMEGRGWGTSDDVFSDLRITVDVRMREYLYPLIVIKDGKVKTIGTMSLLEPEGTVVHNVVRCRSPYIRCWGEGATTVTIARGEQGRGHPSTIIRKTGSDSMQQTHGYDIPQGAAYYMLGIDAAATTYPVTYLNPQATHQDFSLLVWLAGTHPLAPPTVGADNQIRYLQDGKMIGSYTARGTGAYPHISLSWAVCPENVPCPPPPPLSEGGSSPTPPACSESPQLDFAKLCRDQLARQLAELQPILAEYTRRQKMADQLWPDFKWAAAQCAAWKAAELALNTALGQASEDLGAAGENADKVREILKAMIEGDYGGLVVDAGLWEENPDFKSALENTNKFIGYLEKAGTIADLLARNLNGVQGAVMDSCLGAVTPELHLKAQKFVELSKDAASFYAEKVAPAKNNIRSRMLECQQKDHDAWKACRDAATCRGETSNVCGPDPMP